MNNQILLESNLKLFLTELGQTMAQSIKAATGNRIEVKVDTGTVLSLTGKIADAYHQWTNNWLQPYCSRSELAAVMVVELFRSKPIITSNLPKDSIRPLHNLCVVYCFAYIMGLYVKLASSPANLRDQFASRFINQVSSSFRKSPYKAMIEIHQFIENNFRAVPTLVHFDSIGNAP